MKAANRSGVSVRFCGFVCVEETGRDRKERDGENERVMTVCKSIRACSFIPLASCAHSQHANKAQLQIKLGEKIYDFSKGKR